jgi:mRNA-degrading endonuclease RelE of RelBE toxin-antitoxin system
VIPYTIRYTRFAIEALYKIPRGTAGEVSEAIKALAKNPHPNHAFETDLAQGYAMKISGYYVTYQIKEDTRTIKILLIEKEQTEE